MTVLVEELSALVDQESLVAEDRLGEYAVDGVRPRAVVLPTSIESLSQILKFAHTQGLKVVPRGGGTQMCLGNIPKGVDLVVGMERLQGVIAHEPADMTVAVRAGTTLAHLQQVLGQHGQFLAIQAPLPARSTIGGIVATATSGPARLAYGGPRDWIIGISVLHADGTPTKSGGQVVKNVTGYDLHRLYTGSLGTLAVIVGATFKVAPIPPSTTTLMAGFSSVEDAMHASHTLLQGQKLPHSLHLLLGDSFALRSLCPASVDSETVVACMYTGRPRSVEAAVQEARTTLGRWATRSEALESTEGEAFWQGLADLGWEEQCPWQLVLKVLLPPEQVSAFLPRLEMSEGLSRPDVSVIDPGYGMMRLLWHTSPAGPLPTKNFVEAVSQLRGEAQAMQGYLTVERCPVSAKEHLEVWGQDPSLDGLTRRLKEKLDPAGILNPGRFVGRL